MRRSYRPLQVAVVALLVGAGAGARAELTTKSGADYAAQCKQEGVPMPPAWGSSAWRYNGKFRQSFNLSDNWSFIYYYVSPLIVDTNFTILSNPGICVANPRPWIDWNHKDASGEYLVGTDTPVLGVICQGSNGKACFWDIPNDVSWNPSNGQTIYGPTPTGPIVPDGSGNSMWVGGAAISGSGGPCTSCHMGENVFINHPGSATDIPAVLNAIDKKNWFPTSWPDPIVRADDPALADNQYGLGRHWPENPPPLAVPANIASLPAAQNCGTCHVAGGPGGRLPQVSMAYQYSYCSTILGQAMSRPYDSSNPAQGEMPPFAAPAGSFDAWWTFLSPYTDGTTTTGCNAPPTKIVTRSDIGIFSASMSRLF
ncbi:MAG TPA: hypothetical protein VHJ20_21810 [Polyangia bacterium]|nr:hypothetical protein [Polyangia bacterium]